MEPKKSTSAAKIALWIGIICVSTYVVNYYLRNMLSVTTPALLQGGEFNETGIGLLSSAYMIFYAMGQLINGFLGDVVPPRIMVLCGMGLGAASMIVFPFLKLFPLQFLCFAILGFALSMVRGPLMKVISENTEAKHARLICVFFSCANFAGPLIASLFVMLLPTRLAFIVSGVVAIVAVLFSFFALSFMQKKGFVSYRPNKNKSASFILDVFRIKSFPFFMIIACLVEISITSVSFWIPTYLTSHLGFDNNTANLVFSVISICRACMPFLTLAIFNAIGERSMPILRIGFALSAAFFLCMQFVSHAIANVILLILALMAVSCASAILWSIYIPGLGKTGRASSANGVIDCTGYVAAALANLVFATFSDGTGWETVIFLWASIGIIGLIVSLFKREDAKSE